MVSSVLTELPSGVVTFLFTDIEGSTRMLAALGDGYADVIERHDAVLREVWPAHDGHVVNTEGDAFFVAFASADDAVRAAVAAQRAIADEPWPTGIDLRIRIGIHTGFARPRGRDYLALAVNQAARIVGTAHGGQVHLSQEACEELSPDVGVELAPLGLHRVRDFDGPQVLHRVVASGWVDPGRPARARPAEGHNLAPSTTSFLDRDEDRAWLRDHLAAGAVATVVGPGGIGKTRLAVEVGREVAADWDDGVWMVDLGAVGSSDLVGEAVVDALGALRTPGMTTREEIRQHLESRRMVLVLDNCEHVAGAVADLVNVVLATCPQVAVLATSRRALGLRGEQVHRLSPLPVTEEAGPAWALELFAERAGGLPDDQRAAAAELCQQVDGLPLAIEMAAAHARQVPPSAVLQRLVDDGLPQSRDPGLPDRQRSLGALLSASMELLDDRQSEVLVRTAVFAESFDQDLVAVACSDLGLAAGEVTAILWTLVDDSLVLPDASDGATRFRLPRTVRSLLAPRLDDERRATIVAALSQWFRGSVGPERATDREWVSRLGLDLGNVRAIVADLADLDPPTAQELAWSIARLHEVRSEYRRGVDEAGAHLELLPQEAPARVALLTLLADLHLRMDAVERARVVLDEAAALSRRVGVATWDEAGVLRSRGELALRSGALDEAAHWGRRALAASTSPRALARAWNLAGLADANRGRHADAVAAFEEELAAARAAGLETFEAKTHANLAEMRLRDGDAVKAAEHQLASLDLARAQNDDVVVAYAILVAAQFRLEDGEVEEAVVLHAAGRRVLEAAGLALYADDLERAEALRRAGEQALGAALPATEASGRHLTLRAAADRAEAVLIHKRRGN